jgi:RNA recognition motif-containing protein
MDDDDSNSKQIFLSGLNNNVEENDLKNLFSLYGNVVNVVLSKNHTNSKRKDLAFITFENHEQAINAVKMFLNDKTLNGNDNIIKCFHIENEPNLINKINISLAFSQQSMQTKKKIKDNRKKIPPQNQKGNNTNNSDSNNSNNNNHRGNLNNNNNNNNNQFVINLQYENKIFSYSFNAFCRLFLLFFCYLFSKSPFNSFLSKLVIFLLIHEALAITNFILMRVYLKINNNNFPEICLLFNTLNRMIFFVWFLYGNLLLIFDENEINSSIKNNAYLYF